MESNNDDNNNSGWGAFSAFKNEKDNHGDSTSSFSIFTLFFILLALTGIGYYTYEGAFGATATMRPLDNGLVAHWTFDDDDKTGTSTVLDVSGNDNHGVLINGYSGASKFIGTLDNVRIYDRALSPEEIRRLYQSGL